MKIFENDRIWIEREESDIPWLKIFPRQSCRELSECDPDTKRVLWKVLDIIERAMLAYYRPEKINIASFGNYLPRVHLHIMARFREDSHFPEPMWGEKQREAKLDLPPFEAFIALLHQELESEGI
ncbi:MAG: HIT family protein [Campylobacteraceae bacterium 4484_4]|nr:MAG: HIT family protein [Campylobacteraceae bacterium 4484_4]